MSHQYHRRFDPEAQDSLAKLARLVRPGSEVLDVGAGPGVLAAYLAEQRACYVDGIEYDHTSAEQGARPFRSLWVADLNVEAPAVLVGGGRYDYIVCADILEHLPDPGRLLRGLLPLLKPWGRLLLSVPNVAHAGLIAELIGGELRYRDEGLLDRTHLRFFTRTSLRRLLDDCGLSVRSLDTVTVSIKDSEFTADALNELDDSVRERLLASEDALTYQFIVECAPPEAAVPTAALPQSYQVRSLAPVDVIVPVYAGFSETRACIESVLAAPVRATFELVVIDDCGPEPELRAWLRALAEDGRIALIENEENLGYVASVNRGLDSHPDRDVVLLNSDTEVANDWIDRLRAAAYGAADIGTVTPFANSGATICAYPLFCADNPLPEGWDVASLDALVRDTNLGSGVDLPTSVGFCTYIRRDCLNAVGKLDVETFGRGYGEENDFCMRARYLGWRHRLAGDVFVAHRGGVSFGSDKAELVAKAQVAIRERHPAYDLLVAEHIREDPALVLREGVDWQRLARSPRQRLLFISHDLGGGVERHLRELAQWLEPQAEVLVLRPYGADSLSLSWQRIGESAQLVFQRELDLSRLTALLERLHIARVHVHHLLGLEQVARRLVDALGVPYDFTVHDFFPVCPRITLIDTKGRFCDQPPTAVCESCLAADPDAPTGDVEAWRAAMGAWLLGADRVLAPSRDTAERLHRVWPELSVCVASHDQLPTPIEYPQPCPRRWHDDGPLRVVVLGQLSVAKGLTVLADCAREAAARGLPLEFHLLGHPLGLLPSLAEAPLIVHGPYAESELPGRLRHLAPHLAWFPACWPETWSYTLTACLQAALPVAAPRLGAFPERLAAWPWSCLLPSGLRASALNDRLLSFASHHLATFDVPGSSAAITSLADDATLFNYGAAYLMSPGKAASSASSYLSPALLAACSPSPRPFAAERSSGDPLLDRLVRLREENVRLRGGVAQRDAELTRRLEDAVRAWDELARHRADRVDLEQRAQVAEQHALEERIELEGRAQVAEHHALAERIEMERRAQVAEQHWSQERAALDQHAQAVGAALTRRDAEIDLIHRSLSWKLTRPIRGVGWVLRAARAAIVSKVQPFWHRLPLPPHARFRIKTAVFRRAAPLFRGTRVYAAWIDQSRWVDQSQQTLAAACRIYPADPVVENLRVPIGVSAEPTVSVIIPVYNKLDYTLACLDSIAKTSPTVPMEVLVVDDGSTDATEAELSVRDDIRYLRNAENLGFVGSCNRGAEEARGEFLFFLNNDTVVLDGWLDNLVATLAQIPDAGLVGSKLIYPDGRLQEAGGIIWQDGSGWNWGRLADPAAPDFNFLRDVDYCSGAAVLIRRALFRSLGGFDLRYAPAYYEDTDLAFAVRARGLRVLYQPLSQIVHYEGVTAGTDLGSGTKAYQVRNRERFTDKWRESLQTHGDAQAGPPRFAADRRPRARMLLIDACTPTPDQDSGSVDMINYLRMLVDFGYRVTFIPESDLLHFGRYTAALQSIGVECLFHPYIDSVSSVIKARGAEFDVVMLVRGPVAYRHIDAVRGGCPRAKVIFNTVDLHFLRERRRAELETGCASSPEADDMRRMERYVMERSDTTIVISGAEEEVLATEAPGTRVRVIPLLRDLPGRSGGFVGRTGIVFVGGFRHPPNVDAMLWFCADIWPLIRPQLPGITLSIVGSNMGPKVEALEGDDVRVLGFVEDLAPVFAAARLSVAPLRYGAGQKGKVVTSLGYGVPCVLTSVAAEGLGLGAEGGALCADDPEAFAAAVVRLYTDAQLWEQMSNAGMDRVNRTFSVAANQGKLAELLRELGLPA